MQTTCSSTPGSVAEVLFAGDVLLNLSGRRLAICDGVRELQFEPGYPAIVSGLTESAPQSPELSDADGLQKILRDMESGRLVIAVATPEQDVGTIADAATAAGVTVVLCRIIDACGDDAFMDQEDTEAVMERLRQLGYV